MALPDGRIRERRSDGSKGQRRYFYIYPVCQSCGRRKGRSGSPTCIRCRGGPRKGMRLKCPHCGQMLERNALIASMYYAGIGAPDLERIFNISRQAVMAVIHGRKWHTQ